MKKKLIKIHLLIITTILVLIISPISIFAADCSGQVISGGATSHGGAHATGKNCVASMGSCVSGANPDSPIVGLRVQIYHYESSKGANGITLLGSGVDIWTGEINKLKVSNSSFSIPTTPNLKIKASCDKAKTDGSNAYGKDLTKIYSLDLDAYLSGTKSNKKWKVIWDEGMDSYYPEEMYKYILTYDSSGNPNSGWLNENIIVKLRNNTEKDDAFIKDLFNMTDNELDLLKSNTSDIYVTFEMLYRFYIPKGSTYINNGFNAKGDHLYFGTVSEAGIVHGWSNIYNALMSADGNVGKLVSPNIEGTYLIKQVSNVLPVKTGYGNATTTNLNVVCREARGYAVYNIENICKECGEPDCASACKKHANGTTGRKTCAIEYCTTHESGSSSCVSACYSPKTKPSSCTSECGTYEDGTTNRRVCSNYYCDKYESGKKSCKDACFTPKTCLGVCGMYSGGTTERENCAKNYCATYESEAADCMSSCYTTKTCQSDCGKYPDKTTERETCAKNYCNTYEPGNTSCINACYTPKTCESDCSEHAIGTAARRTCAINYCDTNEPGDRTNCINKCNNPTIDWSDGCDRPSSTCTAPIGTSSETCSIDGATPEKLQSNVCYDDSATEYKIGTNKIDIVYYKIDCTETLRIFSQPQPQTLKITEKRLASLYVGIASTYNKTCSLLYKSVDGGWIKEDNITDENKYNTSSMKIKTDIYDYREYKNKLTGVDKANYEKAYEQLKKAYADSKANYDNYSKKTEGIEEDEVKINIDVIDKGSTDFTTKTITMVPTSCKTGTFDNYRFCTMEEAKWTKTIDACKEEIELQEEGGKNVFKYTTFYELPSSYVASLSDNESEVFHDATSCANSVKGANGKCIEKVGVWVFDPFTKNVIQEIERSTKTTGEYTISFENFGSCGQINYDYTCEYEFKSDNSCAACLNKTYGTAEYEECYEKHCGCDSYCGSNVSCRAMYCPEECPECIDESTEKCDCYTEECEGKYTDEDEKLICKYDNCCSAKCETKECEINCCVQGCKAKYSGDNTKIDKCVKLYCRRTPPPGPGPGGDPTPEGGIDYIYRTISMSNPFPDREAGQNWYARVPYITESNEIDSYYYDETNGITDNFEYQFVLSGDDIKKIKEKYNTPYVGYNKSNIKSTKSNNAYCSALLYGRINGTDVEIEGILDNIITDYTINAEAGSGCIK